MEGREHLFFLNWGSQFMLHIYVTREALSVPILQSNPRLIKSVFRAGPRELAFLSLVVMCNQS